MNASLTCHSLTGHTLRGKCDTTPHRYSEVQSIHIWSVLCSRPRIQSRRCGPPRSRPSPTRAVEKDTPDTKSNSEKGDDLKRITEKWGLETSLFKVFTSKEETPGENKGQQAKKLLAQYGSAYLITSISFAIVSFALCYALVSSGVDVASLLARVGIEVSSTSEKVGTFAIAYAAHKALSPVRFPPTVALTPVVAKALGKKSSDGPDP